MNKKNFISRITPLIIWVIVIQYIGYYSSTIIQPSIESWYLTLNKSTLTPPNFIFGTVWAILYLKISIAGWYIFHLEKRKQIVQARDRDVSRLSR